ncbi:hypothetical protein BGHDH14_bgh04668 [Blumeria hordei DH14]|uniref:Uncharacterized protein n=1 Tax=Blumeria graminis f. sp. hordei (strain DH14) TaxID=546991 RepID=N1JFP6_BLUG1|nr:hypothetical protein BGHDH14_bgh04668 [Blumeria hordei DH14]
MSTQTLRTIERALRDRDIEFDYEALKSAMSDTDTKMAIQEWVEEYITPETLLNKEEENMYKLLVQSGDIEAFEEHDLSLVRDLHDHELQAAISDLQKSTAAIEKKSEDLRMQQNALSALIKSEKRTKQSRSQIERAQIRKWDAEKSSVAAVISELTQNLICQSSDLEQQRNSAELDIKQVVEGIFQNDDKLLLSFQKLADSLETDQPIYDNIMAKIKELCARYIKYTVEGVRLRLDRVYLEALHSYSDSQGSQLNSQEESDLIEDLESLYTEILPVVQMSVEQEYLEPASKLGKSVNTRGQALTNKAVEYIQESLKFLTTRMESLLERVRQFQCHRMAAGILLNTTKEELSNRELELKRKDPSQSVAEPLSISRSKRRISNFGEDIGAEQQLARNLSVTLPNDNDSSEASSTSWENLISEKTARLAIHASSLQSTTESCIASHLLDSHVALNLLLDSLLDKSAYRTIRMVDPDLQNAEELLEQDIRNLQDKLATLDLHELQTRNVRRDQIVDRWSRRQPEYS